MCLHKTDKFETFIKLLQFIIALTLNKDLSSNQETSQHIEVQKVVTGYQKSSYGRDSRVKHLIKTKKIKKSLKRPEKFDINFRAIFKHGFQKLISVLGKDHQGFS